MRRIWLSAATLLGSALIASAGASPGPFSERQAIVGKSLDLAPESRMEGREAIDDATAAALIGAISSQFDERTVEVKLDNVEITPAGMIQRDLHGAGRVMIGEGSAWIPFRFSALYDTEQASVGYPDLVLGGDPSGQAALADATMTRKLSVEVDRRLRQEFAQQPAHVALETVHVFPAGGRYLRLQANGTAQFGREGATEAAVQALYDVRTGNWLQISYELGTASDRPSLGNAVANR